MRNHWLALVLFGCTAPPPGNPYNAYADGHAWHYVGLVRAPGDRVRTHARTVRVHAFSESSPPSMSAQGESVEDDVLDDLLLHAGLFPFERPGSTYGGLELPQDLPRAAPWTGSIDIGGGTVFRSEIVGRRSLTVPAGTFNTVVVRSTVGVHPFVIINDYACGVGKVRSLAHDLRGNGWDLRLTQAPAGDPEIQRACAAENLADLTEYGSAAAPLATCDLAALERLGRSLAGPFPSGHPVPDAPAGLAAACAGALPPEIATYLATTEDNPFDHTREVDAWLDGVCPFVERVGDRRSSTSVTRELFDACLAAHGLIDRAAITGTRSHLLAWAVHRWLREQGTSAASAAAILRGLLAHERTPGIRLPRVGGHVLADEMLHLMVTPHELRVDELRVPLRDGQEDPARMAEFTALAQLLADKARDAPTRPVLFSVDAATPMSTFLPVWSLATSEQLETYLQVDNGPDAVRGIQLSTTNALGTNLYIALGRSTVDVVESQWAVPFHRGDTPQKTANFADLDELDAHAARFKRRVPEAEHVFVWAHEDNSLEHLLAVLSAVRGRDCEARGDCRFSKIHLYRQPRRGATPALFPHPM